MPVVVGVAASAVSAVPPTIRARLVTPHVALTGPRVMGHPLVIHNAMAPLPFALRAAPVAPIKQLPLLPPPTPVRALPEFLPRLGFTALPALAGSAACTNSRPGVILSALPATPFTPLMCERDLWASSGRDLPTSLLPGHNKKALYGRAYTPGSSDDP